jgi:glutamate-1-semialdehyde 2,1-aminomutase
LTAGGRPPAGGRRKGARSSALFRRAVRVMPGGVSSPVRSFASVAGEPFFVAAGRGARVRDADGRSYLDFVMSYGPHLFGHGPAFVRRALDRACRRGTSYGAPTEHEVRLAERVVKAFPSIEMVRFVSSGTEATMTAARLARAATGRKRIVKAEGAYHGHGDSFLVAGGSGLATLGIAASPGVPDELAALTSVVPYNDPGALEALFARFHGEIAAFIVEPIAANMGLVPPEPGYLASVRELTRRHGALLIFDEVISGFRVARGGAQELYGVSPDLTTLGKILGGGLPVGAYGGPRDLMEQMAPVGPVYQAGTLSGNPVAVAAGLAALRIIERDPPYERLDRLAAALSSGLHDVFAEAGEPAAIAREGSLLSLFVGTERGPENLDDARRADHARYAAFFHAMLDRGVYLPPSGYEAWFLSTAHTTADVERTVEAARQAVRAGALATSGS